MSVDGRRRVLLYGNSIILGSIGAGLLESAGLDVTACEAPPSDPRLLDVFEPDIILFDSQATHAGALLPLLETHPSVLLIGVSPDVNQVQVWFGRLLPEMSLQGLVDIIENDRHTPV
jgi:hypothetical protein